MAQIRHLTRLAHPIQWLLALLTYGLGLGLARYLGATLLPEPQFLGGVIVLFLLTASNLLTVYFRPFNEPIITGETPREREEFRSLLLIVSLTFLAMVGILIFLLQRGGFLGIDTFLLLAGFILLALANAVPPVRLVNRGLGELSLSVLIASLTPTLAFLLHAHNFHRLLTLFTFPLFLIALSYFIAINFPAYAEDLKYERRSLLISLGWQRAVPIHNSLLIVAYLFLAAIPFLGVPFGLVWPALLTLPLAAWQIFTLRNIADGARPLWPAFIATATAIFGLTAYLITFAFWLR
jgi:1,4-dihydroxy-2-naphthoate octaprenyltransferase